MVTVRWGNRSVLIATAVVGLAAVTALTFVSGDLGRAAPGDTAGDRVFGQGIGTSSDCWRRGVSATNLCAPEEGVALDAAGHLYVADTHRVLEYDNPLTTDSAPDRVFGQGGSFTSMTCNLGGISASSLCSAEGVVVDGAGNLYVADRDNNRVLEYDSPLNTDMVADRVFGQGGSFTTNTPDNGGISASSMHDPTGLALDNGGHLYVADLSNNRVLEYDSPLTSQAADRVFGQGGSFTTNPCNLGDPDFPNASSLCRPYAVAVDPAGNLYVADGNDRRVLEFDSPLTDQVADRVFGQGGSFTSNVCNLGGTSASSLCRPLGVTVDSAAHLYVADYDNSRVLEYDSP